MKIKTIFITAFILLTLSIGVAQAVSVFNSNQAGTNPVNGYYLQTNGVTSTWAAVSGGGSSSTVLYQGYAITLSPNPINTTGTVSVNTSTLNTYIATLNYLTVASGTATYYPLTNPSNFTTTTIQSVLNSLSAVGLATYNSSTGQFSVSSSTLNLGTASHYAFGDFLPSSTVYVANNTGNWAGTWHLYNPSDFLSSSTVYISTTTGNWQGTWKTYNPSDFLTSSTIYLSTTTGNWIGTWQGANSSTFYLATNPNHYVATSSLGTAALYNYTDFLPSSTIYLSTNTGNWAGTWQTHAPSYFQTALGFTPYNSTNPSGYLSSSTGLSYFFPATTTIFLSTSTGLTTSNFATTSISQWNNDAHYVTSTGSSLSSSTIWGLFSNTATGLTYTNTNGATALTSGYFIPLTASGTQWNAAYASSSLITSPLGSNAFSSIAIPTSYVSTINNTNNSNGNYSIGVSGYGLFLATSSTGTTLNIGTQNTLGSGGVTFSNYFGYLEAALSTSSISQFTNDVHYLTSSTGVTSFNGSTGAVTGVSSLGGSTGAIAVGKYLSGGSTLTVSSTLASSSWKFDISNATTTNNTSTYTEWTTDQAVNITNILCKDSVATTSLFIFVPTSYATTTVSSTIASNFTCGISSHSSSTNLTFPINTPIITEVTSTVGTPVSTPVQITYTKL
jgi:hypothetical protein